MIKQTHWTRYIPIGLILLLVLAPATALFAQGKTVFAVKYISAENVYLNGGARDSLAQGDECTVLHNGKEIARLRVAYVAGHSASCEILEKKEPISAGDRVVVVRRAPRVSNKKKEKTEAVKQAAPVKKRKRQRRSAGPKISGYLSAQWYRFDDLGAGNRDFNQPTFRFSLRARRLFGDAYTLRIKARSRYDQRRYASRTGIPDKEWHNRLYEVSFRYENENAPFNYAVGRVFSNAFSGVGYIDGLMAQHNINTNWRWGLFGGIQPEWQYADVSATIQKYGVFASYSLGDFRTRRFASTLSLAGAYHNSEVSREFMYWQNSYTVGSRLYLFQSLELDLNRDWKQTTTHESVSMTGLYLNGRYQFNNQWSLGMSYDNRKNYLTWFSRDLADSLFDDAFRQGLRLSVNGRLFRNFRVYGNAGLRHRQDQPDITWSYMAGVNWNRIMRTAFNFNFRYAGFNNFYTIGVNPTVSAGWRMRGGHQLRASYGYYGYTLKADQSFNQRQWMRFNADFELPVRIFLSSEYQYEWGDDLNGQRFFIELGYRL
ncbi:MAG: hypothetical protein D6677_04970 [Calditrichaeota bacterium]|nr:MAG: hypothetical protein D6677_04970 [Calditrichota bacterium]